MTVSVGIALSEPGITAAELLRNADAALYRAKEDGRDRHALFMPELIERATRRLGLEHELREAMRTEALFLDYQPVRRLGDGTRGRLRGAGPLAAPGARGARPGRLPADGRGHRPGARDRPLRAAARLRRRHRAGAAPDAPNVSVNISARHVGARACCRGWWPGR